MTREKYETVTGSGGLTTFSSEKRLYFAIRSMKELLIDNLGNLWLPCCHPYGNYYS